VAYVRGAVGFAYRLTHLPQITVVGRPGWPKLRATADGTPANWPPVYQLPPIGSPMTDTLSQGEGIWTAVQVSPATRHLRATASDGSSQLVTPRVVGGRRYAAFTIGTSLRLTRLTWLDAAGREIASTTALPRYGYTQFQP
jgi:hypothetical protein